MKKIVLVTLVFFAFISTSYSQNEIKKYEYATVYFYLNPVIKTDLIIYYGNGKQEDFKKLKGVKLKNREGKYLDIITDALNYMGEQGYELVTVTKSDAPVFHYLFMKEKLND